MKLAFYAEELISTRFVSLFSCASVFDSSVGFLSLGVPVLPVASLARQPSTCLLVVGGFFCPSEVGLFVAAL